MSVNIERLKRLKKLKDLQEKWKKLDLEKELQMFIVKELPFWLKWATTWDVISLAEIPDNISVASLVSQGYIIPLKWNNIDKEEYKGQRRSEIINELERDSEWVANITEEIDKEIKEMQEQKKLALDIQDKINHSIRRVWEFKF